MRIRVIREGRPKDARLRALQEDYAGRIAHFVDIRLEERSIVGRSARGLSSRLSAAERKWLQGLEGSFRVLLDPAGSEWTSAEFAEWLGRQGLRGTRELAFLVGGDKGFPAAVRDRANLLLGLSRMTLTHDWACTLLLEQIYRGFTILRGFPYAK